MKPLMSIVMAVRNELGNIEPTVRGINALDGDFELIFVEGHSHDGTLDEIKRVAGLSWRYPVRFTAQDGSGKKDALLKGFEMARGDIFLMYDPDGEVPAEEIEKFYQKLAKNDNLFIFGNRFVANRSRKMRFLNWIGNLFFAFFVSFLVHHWMRDVLLGIKGFWRKHYQVMKKGGVFNNSYDRFAEFDLIFGASRAGLDFESAPVRYEHRRYGETKVRIFKTGLELLKRCFLEFFYRLSLDKLTSSRVLVLILIFAIALGLRLININGGFFDHASVRSAETYTIAKNFITQNLPIWNPRVDWGGPNGGFVKFEFQLYTYILAWLMKIFGLSVILARLLTIAISLVSGWFFYKILIRFFSPAGAIFGLAVFILNPIMVYFGRAIQPDSLMILFGIFAIWLVIRKEQSFLADKILALISMALALMLKPTAGVFLASFLILFFNIDSWRQLFKNIFSFKILLYVSVILAIVMPAWFYYSYIDKAGDFGELNLRGWWISWESFQAYFYNPLYQKYIFAAFIFFNPIGWLALFKALFLKYSKKDFFIQPFIMGVWAFAVAHSPLWLQGFHEWHFMLAVPAMGLAAAKIFDDWKDKSFSKIFSPWILAPLYLFFIPPAIYGLFFISNTKAETIYHNVGIIKQYVPENKVTAVTDPGATITNFYSGRIGVYAGFPITKDNLLNKIKVWGADFLLVTRPNNLTEEEQALLSGFKLIHKNETSLLYELY